MLGWSRRLTLVAAVLLLSLGLLSQGPAATATDPEPPQGSEHAVLPITAQPFYPALEASRRAFRQSPLLPVVGDSPRSTLLNFYAVMAEVDARTRAIVASRATDPGFNWSPALRQQIRSVDRLLHKASEALDLSLVPERQRADAARERSLQLKVILDAVLASQADPLEIPDAEQFAALGRRGLLADGRWRLPGTPISLAPATAAAAAESDGGVRFSAGTVQQIPALYAEILPVRPAASTWYTPDLYSAFAHSPGDTVPPKWYVQLPSALRHSVLELPIASNSVLQLGLTLVLLLVLCVLVWWLLRRWIRHQRRAMLHGSGGSAAWRRVLDLLPLPPLTAAANSLIDHEINITGPLDLVLGSLFACLFTASLVLLVVQLFEALGYSLARSIVRVRGRRDSSLSLQRAHSFVLPLCRVAAMVVGVALLFRLLLDLGIPAATVLTFSAVPGLAIGLGASKLLGNLFAGLAIQTDRPLRLGEFCQIGPHQGFITRIGLRSLQIQTLDALVTIPNALVDDQMVVNYTIRQADPSAPALQQLDLRLPLDQPLPNHSLREVLRLVQRDLAADPRLLEPVVSLDPHAGGAPVLMVLARVHSHDWSAVLTLREQLMIRLRWCAYQARRSVIRLGLSYATTPQQLRQLPVWLAELFAAEANTDLAKVVFDEIADFAYVVQIAFRTDVEPSAFQPLLSRIHTALLELCAAHDLEIPFPTRLELQQQLHAAPREEVQ